MNTPSKADEVEAVRLFLNEERARYAELIEQEGPSYSVARFNFLSERAAYIKRLQDRNIRRLEA